MLAARDWVVAEDAAEDTDGVMVDVEARVATVSYDRRAFSSSY